MLQKTPILLCALILATGCGDDAPGGMNVPDATPMTVDGATADAMPDDAAPPALDDNLRRMVLVATARAVLMGTYERFAVSADDLVLKVQAWSGDSGLEEAQAAWRATMDIWQQAEVMQFGPAAAMEFAPDVGMDLRDDIYSWTTVSRCRVDQEIVERAFAAGAETFRSEGVNVRGLDALEYLLFNQTTENSCSSGSGINRSGSWAAIPATELTTRRQEYARVLAELVAATADTLKMEWSRFITELESAGSGSTLYATGQEGLNGLSDALFYLDKETKDMKLAIPAGLSVDCMAMSCPQSVESDIANHSLENVRQNLIGFQAAFNGALHDADGAETRSEMSFRGLLTGMGAEALVADTDAALAAAFAAFAAVDGSLADAVVNDRDDVVTLYNAVKAVTDILKTSFVGTLDLELPMRAEGDND